MAADIEATRLWLSEKGIKVPDDWLEQCIAFVKEEMKENGRSDVDTLLQKVYEQWLLADLREIAFPLFPTFVTTARRVVLTGTYCVQVDSMIDIGASAYNQLQKCTSTLNDNNEVDAEADAAEEAKPWEQKPTRMYKLELSDGLTTIDGVEDGPIPALHSGLLPGFKVCIHGRVECRQGILFLNSDNLCVLGGNVEPLIEENSLINVLTLKLAACSAPAACALP